MLRPEELLENYIRVSFPWFDFGMIVFGFEARDVIGVPIYSASMRCSGIPDKTFSAKVDSNDIYNLCEEEVIGRFGKDLHEQIRAHLSPKLEPVKNIILGEN